MHAGDFDLVLSDVNVPQRDGVTPAHCLCTSEQRVPVVLMSKEEKETGSVLVHQGEHPRQAAHLHALCRRIRRLSQDLRRDPDQKLRRVHPDRIAAGVRFLLLEHRIAGY